VSWTGLVFALLHFAGTCWVWRNEEQNRHGGFINLNGFGTMLLSAPSWLTLGWLLRRLGVPKPRWHERGLGGRLEIGAHVLVTSGLVYLLGWLLERLAVAVCA